MCVSVIAKSFLYYNKVTGIIMEKQQALKLLGLEGEASKKAIVNAHHSKQQALIEKLSAAPTDALKTKLQKMNKSLDEALALLTSSSPGNEGEQSTSAKSKRSPLTESKLFDIPGLAPDEVAQIDLSTGAVLAGRYTIEEQIGAGGMGAIYSAMDANTNEPVAIKLMLPSLVKNQRAQQRFMEEARISQKLSHPNIVNVYDVQNDGELFFLTMELLEGQDLRTYLESLKNTKQSVPQSEVIRIVSGVCDALIHAHETTIHRDIKPENIWLTDDGKIKVMDFGLARLQSASQRSSSGAVLGTAYYMAPEQIQGRSDIDGKADQYAIGVLLYEMLSGQVPAGRIQSLHSINKEVPKKLSLTVDKLLSTEPEERFNSVGELKAALGNTEGFVMPSLPIKGLGIAAAVIAVVLLIGGLAGSGGLDNVWQALKPIDKELMAKQKAEVAKLQGEIKNYQRRLENGRRQLDSDLRDAARNDDPQGKYLEHWQAVTDNYLFEGDLVTDLEGDLSMGESLLRENSIEPAGAILTKVRDGYKDVWSQFSNAADLKRLEDQVEKLKGRWLKRKLNYGLADPPSVEKALRSIKFAKDYQREGQFSASVQKLEEAEIFWGSAYDEVNADVIKIDKERARQATINKKIQQERDRKAVEELANEESILTNVQSKYDWYLKEK